MSFDTRGPDQGSTLTEGWQPDPAVSGQERWFDGARWTNMTRPVGGAPKPITEVPVRRAETFSGSPLLTPPAPPAPEAPAPVWRQVGDVYGTAVPPQARGGSRAIALMIALMLVMAGVGVYLSRPDSGPSHPTEWDPRVADIAAFVEGARGARFEHPVYIDFLDVQQFKDEVSGEKASAEEREALERAAAMLRAVGLLSGKVDLEAMLNQAASEGYIGFYDPATERITVRGAELTPAVKATLAHELTHALQDQLYGLDDLEDADSPAAMRGVVEADAERVEDAYVDSLPEADRAAYEAASESDAEGANLDGVPEVLLHTMFFPYTFGPPFLSTVLDDGSDIEDVYDDPPTSEADLLNPYRYLSKTELDLPDEPDLPDGHEAWEEGSDFGQTMLVEMLSARVGFLPAWKAVQGWRGDRYAISTDRSDKVCVAVNVRFDSEPSAARFSEVAATWAGVVKGTAAQTGADVLLRSCDPGADFVLPAPVDGGKAFELMSTRAALLAEIAALPEANSGQAVCLTDSLVEQFGADLGRALTVDPESDPKIAAVWMAAGQQCLAG